MRTLTTSLALALALAAACERDGLAPIATTQPEPEPEPEPEPDLPPPCRDGTLVDGTCLVPATFGLPYAYNNIRPADFDGDGEDEFFAINPYFEVSWALFFTGGLVSSEPEFLDFFEFTGHDIHRQVLLDFDGDGRTDLVTASEHTYWQGGDTPEVDQALVAWRNRGEFRFEEANYSYCYPHPGFAAGDVDGDGRTDLFGVCSETIGFVAAHDPETDKIKDVLLLDLKPLQIVGDQEVAAADYNGDAYADFVMMDTTGRVWWIIGGPDYQLTVLDPQAPVLFPPESRSLYARDLDGDGLIDLAAVHVGPKYQPDHTISLALGRPDGGFTALPSFVAADPLTQAGGFGPHPRLTHLGFFDLNSDGKLALVYAHAGRPELVIHPRLTETLGDTPVILPLDFPAASLFVDDFEGDGEDAIYVAISDSIKVEPSKENPDGSIDTHYLVRFSPDP